MILLILVVSIILLSLYLQINKVDLDSEIKKNEFLKKPNQRLELKRIINKRYNNTNREIPIDSPLQESNSSFTVYSQSLQMIDKNKRFINIIYQTQYSKEKADILKELIKEYNEIWRVNI